MVGGLGGGLQDGIANINMSAQNAQQAAQLGYQQNQVMSAGALNIAALNLQGTEAIWQLEQLSTAANVVADTNMLGLKQAQLLGSKVQETAMLVAQYREKTLGLFYSILDQKTSSVWGRMKQISQGFKF